MREKPTALANTICLGSRFPRLSCSSGPSLRRTQPTPQILFLESHSHLSLTMKHLLYQNLINPFPAGPMSPDHRERSSENLTEAPTPGRKGEASLSVSTKALLLLDVPNPPPSQRNPAQQGSCRSQRRGPARGCCNGAVKRPLLGLCKHHQLCPTKEVGTG